MHHNIYKSLLISLLILGSALIGFSLKSSAQEAAYHSFPGVAPFITPSGRFGLFEQGTGRIFLYDDNLSDCVFIGQLKKLGEPIEKIQ